MSTEFEAVAADALSIPPAHAHGHARPPGSPCANCATALQGPWCHACGQYGDDYHRSAWHLVREAFEGLFHFDSRFWRTLPDLLLRPARLTRAYIEGHRAPQIPPLRLVLVVLLLLFVVGSLVTHDHHRDKKEKQAKAAAAQQALPAALDRARAEIAADPESSAKDKATALATLDRAGAAVATITGGQARAGAAGGTGAANPAVATPATPKTGNTAISKDDRRTGDDDAKDDDEKDDDEKEAAAGAKDPAETAAGDGPLVKGLSLEGKHPTVSVFGHELVGAEEWLTDHIDAAKKHPEEFKHVVEEWSERFAFLMIPTAALILSVLFVFQREYWLFDHLVFSMHSLAFQGLLLLATMLGSAAGLPGTLAIVPSLACPLHLFVHMRGAYRCSTGGTLIRMFLLGIGSLFGAILLLVGLLAVGLAGVDAG